MDTLRSTAHLQREIGDDLFAALVSSDNTEAVREFAKTLVNNFLPNVMTVGGHTYDILSFLRGKEESVPVATMVARAKEMNAHLGSEDGENLLKNQGDIPVKLRGKVVFVFSDWRCPGSPGVVDCVYWRDDSWIKDWGWLGDGWNGRARVLRRKS